MQNVPENLHRNQGINHLNRVLDYAPMVAEDGKASVYLTPEDWHVVMDTLFHMQTPREALPAELKDFVLHGDGSTIRLTTEDLVIDLEMI